MNTFADFLAAVEDQKKRERMEELFNFIRANFPDLKEEIKWKQPMFTNNGTFIIAFSIAKPHIAVAPERAAIKKFEERIMANGYSCTLEMFRIKWTDKIDFDLIKDMVAYNIEIKKDVKTFWNR